MEISVPGTEAMHVGGQPVVGPLRRSDYTKGGPAKLPKHKCGYCGDGFGTRQGRGQHATPRGLVPRAVHWQGFVVGAVLGASPPLPAQALQGAMERLGRGRRLLGALGALAGLC